MKKLLVATVKPFAPMAVEGIKKIAKQADYEFILLEKYGSQEELKAAIADVDAVIVRSDKITADVIEAAKNLKIIARAGAGYDNVDLEAATKKGIVVMNTPGQNSNAVAELAFGMMVSIARNNYNGKAGSELRDKKLGLHAFGNVGRYMAEIARGFGMQVYAYDPFVSKDEMIKHEVKPVDSAEELYKTCQYISLHIPANEKTKGSINSDLMQIMPENATIINTARKEVVCENCLLETFEKRPDFKYVADIAPDCKDQIAEKYEGRYFFTPKKMGAQTLEANVNAGLAAATQIVNFLENGDDTFKVN